jgi:multisubunit Na+/H+ antiporter MnhF subunit
VLFIHPAVQMIAVVISLLVMRMGIQRAEQNHLGMEKNFNWKQHVVLGRIALILLCAGTVAGLVVTRLNWKGFLITGMHGYTGIMIGLLVLSGICSGNRLNGRKSNSRKLIIFHGINNTVLMLLLLFQMYSGYKVYMTFVLNYQ